MSDNHAPLALLALALGGCAAIGHPAQDRDNEVARVAPPLHAIIEGRNLDGVASVVLPDGEVLKGRYSITTGGALGLASVSGAASEDKNDASGGSVRSAVVVPRTGEGVADLVGAKGTTAHCQFVNNNWTGHGDGVCKLSSGAVFRMQY